MTNKYRIPFDSVRHLITQMTYFLIYILIVKIYTHKWIMCMFDIVTIRRALEEK